uniref:(northern house mosquito) hypothetical protein n=1 Tax=Culex pipiens TaxID=7175 RepID=A0A8D8ISY6_CULPI
MYIYNNYKTHRCFIELVSDALSMSSPATMAAASTLIGNVTSIRIATMEVTSETVIITIPQQSAAHNTSVLMVPVLNIPSAVMVAETAGMVRMNTIVVHAMKPNLLV